MNTDSAADQLRVQHSTPTGEPSIAILARALIDRLGNILASSHGGSPIRTAATDASGLASAIIDRAAAGALYFRKIPAPTAKTVTATLTVAEILSGLITVNQGAAAVSTLTTPTGTALVAALPIALAIGDSFDLVILNISTVAAEDAVLAAGTGVTIVGNATINSNDAIATQSQATFRFRYAALNTWVAYRIG